APAVRMQEPGPRRQTLSLLHPQRLHRTAARAASDRARPCRVEPGVDRAYVPCGEDPMTRPSGGTRLALALALAACSAAGDPTGDAPPVDVQATASGGRITITNTADTDIVYGARDARVQFIQPQCWTPDVCPWLAHGATAEIPFDEIVGYEASTTEVIISIREYVVDPEEGPVLRGGTELRVKL